MVPSGKGSPLRWEFINGTICHRMGTVKGDYKGSRGTKMYLWRYVCALKGISHLKMAL